MAPPPAPVFSVPSGNFGNICAGILAWKSGLPVTHFKAACNVNDVVPVYLQSGHYQPVKARANISNAMDVGDPSNFVRIMQTIGQSFPLVSELLSSYSISDAETMETIARVYREHNYLLDPHGAVGYAAFEKYLEMHQGAKGIVLETAHPVKFPESVEKATGIKINIPSQAGKIMELNKKSTHLEPKYTVLKDLLLQTEVQ